MVNTTSMVKYPAHMLPSIAYSAENRERLLNRLESKRMMQDQSRWRNRDYSVMAFKVPYNHSLYKMRLKREVDQVVSLAHGNKWGAASLRIHDW